MSPHLPARTTDSLEWVRPFLDPFRTTIAEPRTVLVGDPAGHLPWRSVATNGWAAIVAPAALPMYTTAGAPAWLGDGIAALFAALRPAIGIVKLDGLRRWLGEVPGSYHDLTGDAYPARVEVAGVLYSRGLMAQWASGLPGRVAILCPGEHVEGAARGEREAAPLGLLCEDGTTVMLMPQRRMILNVGVPAFGVERLPASVLLPLPSRTEVRPGLPWAPSLLTP